MKSTLNNKSKKARIIGFAVLSSLALSPVGALADSGHGSIRGAQRSAPPPPQHTEPPHAPPPQQHQEQRDNGPPRNNSDQRDNRGRQDIHAPPPPPPARDDHAQQYNRNQQDNRDRHDWDTNDDNGQHWGGYGPRVPDHHDRGEHLRDLPVARVSIFFNSQPYFYDADGYYYQPQPDGQYVVIQPPTGAVVPYLPAGIVVIPFGGATYYYLDGVFYTQQGDNAYVVVNPPFRIIVPTLPSGATQLQFKDVVFYQFDGYNYTPIMQDGAVGYMVTPIS
jgi:hypothetical protein